MAGHALLLLLFLRASGVQLRTREAVSEELAMLWLDISRPAVDPPAAREVTRPPANLRRVAIAAPKSSITVPAPIPAPPPADQPDWYREGAVVARNSAEASARPRSSGFSEPPKPVRKKCEKRKSSFEWNPEPKRAGFAGVLPYVRLGRCIVGLGFFGCRVGAPPEPNSHLFDDLQDPDRVTNSVPDLGNCNS